MTTLAATFATAFARQAERARGRKSLRTAALLDEIAADIAALDREPPLLEATALPAPTSPPPKPQTVEATP